MASLVLELAVGVVSVTNQPCTQEAREGQSQRNQSVWREHAFMFSGGPDWSPQRRSGLEGSVGQLQPQRQLLQTSLKAAFQRMEGGGGSGRTLSK